MKRGCDLQKEILSEASSSEAVRVADVTVEIPPPSNDNVKVLCRKEGNMFYISNIVSYNNSTLSITDQTQLALTRLKDTLNNLKVSTKNIVSVCLYVRNMADFAAVNSVYKTLFDINPPVRGCVEVCLSRNIDLQLDCIGYINGDDKSTLHVQSISHWASANIGPYSQAVKFDGKIYVAGQIALCPASMTIIEGGIVPQTLLSLRHTDRILDVMAPDCTLNSVLLCICYITKPAFIPVVKREWKKEAKTINIKQYGELESSNHTSLIQCIVVPTLPKHGLVEWLVYAAEHTAQLTELNIVENYSNHKVKIDVIHSTDSQNIFTCKASLELTSNAGLIYKDLIQHLFEEYDKVLIKMKLDWRSVPLLRIFFPTSIFNYDQLFNDVNRSIESLTDVTPVFSLVPVIALDTPAQIMAVCH
ncbi:uncharacterized protein LOC126821085 [Patella vulgata]|uniref:uncharacterized protein LOC126821085 n=1 Tax=Patella vulgata TaxID=6465 RepID=UPI0024A7AA03|nr:uncharacterized protein LOC126821085 [Patella vulgata]